MSTTKTSRRAKRVTIVLNISGGRGGWEMNFCVRKATMLIVLLGFSSSMLGGCYPQAVGPADSLGGKLTWKEMDLRQRKAHMRAVILPKAGEVFRAWRPEKYARVDCGLCHGPGAMINSFEMPTSYLPRLSGELLLGPEFKKHPDTTRLKLTRLVPSMAAALGKKRFSILTRRGFGCYSCHMGPDGPIFGN